MRAKDAIGRYGEDVAARLLSDAGFTLLHRNWRCRDGEIDIVAVDGGVLVFCEVKTRSSASYGTPAEAVTATKAARVRRLAARWLTEERASGSTAYWPDIRFDVVCVTRAPRGAAVVEHLRGAF